MIGSQYRMSEFTGGVLLAQIRKLDTIIGALRGHARECAKGSPTCPTCTCAIGPIPPVISARHLARLPFAGPARQVPGPMRAENVPANPPRPWRLYHSNRLSSKS